MAAVTTTMNNPDGSDVPVERRCENADCNASKLLSLVPKRKVSQFIVEPNVMEKPMLINGFTTVFQIDGPAAKLSDVKNVPSTGAPQPKTIYRIVPNTHAHIVNYVVVDAEGEALRKINGSDPATMRKLLESQKSSADKMLKKLIAGVATIGGGASHNTSSSPTGGGGGAAATAPSISAATMPQTLPLVRPQQTSVGAGSQIQLPVRMHPNLKITAVASAETVAAMNTPSVMPSLPTQPTQVLPTMPLITPVPLSTLQSSPSISILRPASVPVAAVSTPPSSSSAAVVDTVEKPVFDKMQAELQELRRTVAMLAEAQAKNQQQHQQQQQHVSAIPAKRLR